LRTGGPGRSAADTDPRLQLTGPPPATAPARIDVRPDTAVTPQGTRTPGQGPAETSSGGSAGTSFVIIRAGARRRVSGASIDTHCTDLSCGWPRVFDCKRRDSSVKSFRRRVSGARINTNARGRPPQSLHGIFPTTQSPRRAFAPTRPIHCAADPLKIGAMEGLGSAGIDCA
jgi:hypothetical protein